MRTRHAREFRFIRNCIGCCHTLHILQTHQLEIQKNQKHNKNLICIENLNYNRIFNYILKLMHTGCQWSELPIMRLIEFENKTRRKGLFDLKISLIICNSLVVVGGQWREDVRPFLRHAKQGTTPKL